MDATIDGNAILDYIEFDILPSLNRYEIWAFYGDSREKVASGILENLLLHSAKAKSLHSIGSNSKFVVTSPKELQKINWFTISTLKRFLQIIGSPNILDATNSLAKEISQLEEARNFHLTLYTKAESSDPSKNELLRAMDLRLSALRRELTAAFDQAHGARYSLEDLVDVQKFSDNFGSGDLSGLLLKYIELRQGSQAIASISGNMSSEAENIEREENRGPTVELSSSELLDEFAASTARENERYSLSSEGEEQPSVERSRTLTRYQSPRRSASPMRRIQIGRSGSRRSTAITIKSLNYFPARDRPFLTKDASSDSGDEESERPLQKSENSVKRISVRDAIHMFESKQKDQTVDVPKMKPSVNATIGSNKSVLRRWSSGIVEDISSSSLDAAIESSEKSDAVCEKNEETAEDRSKTEFSPVVVSKDTSNESCCPDVKLNSTKGTSCGHESMQKESLLTESDGTSDKLVASEWNRQKEAELDELLRKMMESKPAKVRTTATSNAKREVFRSEQRGVGSYNHKEKRDEKISASAAKKVVPEKSKTVKHHDPKKNEPPSAAAVSDAGKRPNLKKIPRQQKVVSESAKPKTGSSPAGIVKKAAPKASSLPATRKSWPSLSPSTKVTTTAAKGPSLTSSASAVPARRKSTPSVAESSPKVDQAKTTRTKKIDNKKSSRIDTGMKQQQSALKPGKMAEKKSRVQNSDKSDSSPAKPSLYSKVTKKSSVVPIEPKPFLRKSSGIVPVISSATTGGKDDTPSDFREPLMKSEDLISTEKSLCPAGDVVVVTQQEPEPEPEPEPQTNQESNMDPVKESDYSPPRSPPKCEESSQVEPVIVDDDVSGVAEAVIRIETEEEEEEEEEECTISPQAWVEIEETDEGHHISRISDSPTNLLLPQVRESSPRVRHSLSQMLLEEIHEHDEWRNSENPHHHHPFVHHHKDEQPKGLKRLLKFGRKAKSDANSNGCSSPSAFSEAEDDAAEITSFANKNSRRQHNGANEKSAQGYYKSKFSPAQSFSPQEGNVSTTSVTSTKARSFFSLSAFKSSK